jgi:uncharacterized protein (DUF2236 family)
MQLMLPGLGAGVTDHSNFFDDPYDRIFRSIPVIWGTIFSHDEPAGDEPDGDQRGRFVRDLHRDIKGTDHHGERYHALDPEVFWWAHATFTWEFLRARELYFARPWSRREKEQLYAESVTWWRRYGLSDRPVPRDYRSFRAKFDHICRTELELTPAVRWVLDPARNEGTSSGPPVRLPGPLSVFDKVLSDLGTDVYAATVYGAMPDVVRRRFDLPWDNADRARFAAVCATLRSLGPAIDRGMLAGIFPEGTPHLRPGSRDEVVEAPPNPRQRARTRQPADAAS